MVDVFTEGLVTVLDPGRRAMMARLGPLEARDLLRGSLLELVGGPGKTDA